MIGCVYLTINLLNGRSYIGQTALPVRSGYIGSGRIFKLARRKYGKSLFGFHVLHEFETQDEIDQCERDYISILRFNGADLYNIAPGGFRGGCGKLSVQHKKKLSASKKGIKFSDAHKASLKLAMKSRSRIGLILAIQKMRQTMLDKGIPHGRLGKSPSEEAKKKSREKKLGVPISFERLSRRLAKNAELRRLGLHLRGPRKKHA